MTREEAIYTLRGLFIPCASDGNKWGCDRNEAIDMAIHALHQPPNEDWERYSDFLWKEAYGRGKQDALKGGDKYD